MDIGNTGAVQPVRVSSDVGPWLLVAPALIFVTAFYLFPALSVGALSFTDPVPGLGNYVDLAASQSARHVLWVTFKITFITALLAVALGYVLALAITFLSQTVHKLLILAIVLPMWISALVRAFCWLLLLGNNGVVNQTLLAIGVIGAPVAFVRNEIGVVVGMVHYLIPYAVLPLLAVMQGIDKRQLWAARSLGSSTGYTLWRVFIPQTLTGVAGAFVLVFIFGLGFFVTPAVLGGGKVLMASEFVTMLVLQMARWGQGAALAVALLVASAALMVVLSRFMSIDRQFGKLQ